MSRTLQLYSQAFVPKPECVELALDPIVSKKSKNLVERQKQDAFKRLFKLLDSDGDNFISEDYISLSEVPSEVLRILKPIF